MLILIHNSNNHVEPYGKNQASFLYNRLLQRLKHKVFSQSKLGAATKFILRQKKNRENIRVFFFPNTLKSQLVLAPLCRLLGIATISMSWRLYSGKSARTKLGYYLERWAIGLSTYCVCICDEQRKGIASQAKQVIYLPPLVRRKKWARHRQASDTHVWCPGGSDRDETAFLEYCQQRNVTGLRSSAKQNILAAFSAMLPESAKDTAHIVDINDIVTMETLPVIFLKTNDNSNPAGLTVLFELMYPNAKFILPDYCQSYFAERSESAGDNTLVQFDRTDLAKFAKQYRIGCKELQNVLSD